MAHVVRPLVVASPNNRNGKPAGVVIGQKSSHVPVGRATAQPRVNVNNIYSPYASCVMPEKAALQRENVIEAQPLQVLLLLIFTDVLVNIASKRCFTD